MFIYYLSTVQLLCLSSMPRTWTVWPQPAEMQTETSGPDSWAGLCPPHPRYKRAGRPGSGRPLARTDCLSGEKSDGRQDVGAKGRVFRATRPRSRLGRMGRRPAGLPSSGAHWRGDHRCFNVLRGKNNKKTIRQSLKRTKATKKGNKYIRTNVKNWLKGEKKP